MLLVNLAKLSHPAYTKPGCLVLSCNRPQMGTCKLEPKKGKQGRPAVHRSPLNTFSFLCFYLLPYIKFACTTTRRAISINTHISGTLESVPRHDYTHTHVVCQVSAASFHSCSYILHPMHKLKLTVIDTAAEMPDFSIPESELEFKEEDADRKDPASHRKYLAQLELQVQCKKVLLHCTPYASECYCSTLKIRQHRAVLSACSSSLQVYIYVQNVYARCV